MSEIRVRLAGSLRTYRTLKRAFDANAVYTLSADEWANLRKATMPSGAKVFQRLDEDDLSDALASGVAVVDLSQDNTKVQMPADLQGIGDDGFDPELGPVVQEEAVDGVTDQPPEAASEVAAEPAAEPAAEADSAEAPKTTDKPRKLVIGGKNAASQAVQV